MENAAKALTMAAGVLIGVIIITIAVYLFTTLGNTSSEVYSKVEQEKIDKFTKKKATLKKLNDEKVVIQKVEKEN